MITKVTHVTVFVNNQDEALSFYQKLGFAVHTDAQFGAMRWLTVNLPEQKDVELCLMLAETEAEKALVGKQAGDKPLIAFATTDCKGDYESLKAAGIEFMHEPKEEPWGVSVAFKDLYGNMLYLCQPVAQ